MERKYIRKCLNRKALETKGKRVGDAFERKSLEMKGVGKESHKEEKTFKGEMFKGETPEKGRLGKERIFRKKI